MRVEKLQDAKCEKCDGAKCDDHKPLVLLPKCHSRDNVVYAIEGLTVELYCHACHRMVVELETDGFVAEGEACECGEGFVAAYHKAHEITFWCPKCEGEHKIAFSAGSA